MLKFLLFEDGAPASRWPLRNAYLIGADGSAMRSEIVFEHGELICEKREAGAAALALQHRVGDLGELTLQTCLLPEREEPYLLALELARHRLMVFYAKLEEWAMFDLGEDHPVTRRAERARPLFIEALAVQNEQPARADALGQECLVVALDGTEELALSHSELLLNKRKSSGGLSRCAIGCGVHPGLGHDRLRLGLQANFDFVQLPTAWRALAPQEGEYQWSAMDSWIEWASRRRLPVVAGPLISFEPTNLPDWLYIWEHDFETVRDLVYEHIERVVGRYRGSVSAWKVVSGLHVNSHFPFNFEQLMDLTRMTTMLVKKIAPASKALIELRQPFGEYYAQNPRSIPPMMYVDLIAQSGIAFDGLSLRLLMGQAVAGQYTRDLMQVSNLLDQFAGFGKPVHLTIGSPSEPVTEMMIAAPVSGEPVDPNSGYWRRPWSWVVQGHWLEAIFQIAISKPFVEAVAWRELMDHPDIELPLSGLLSEAMEPKAAFRRLVAFRQSLLADGNGGAIRPATMPGQEVATTGPAEGAPGDDEPTQATGQTPDNDDQAVQPDEASQSGHMNRPTDES